MIHMINGDTLGGIISKTIYPSLNDRQDYMYYVSHE